MDWAERNPGRCGVAWHSVANISYLAGSEGRAFIEAFARFVEVAPTASPALDFALRLPMKDFEDALQVAAADALGAQVIATRNTKDYRDSPVRALLPGEVLRLAGDP